MSMHSMPMPAWRPNAKAFYAVMSLAALAVAVLGFVPTYFAPLANGAFSAPGIVHLHGALFFAWMLFFCMQSWLIYAGRTLSHREWGLAGVSLATAMVFSVFIAASAMIELRSQAGFGEQAIAFTWVQIGGIVIFGGFVGAAIANVRRPEVHKRLMLLATLSLLDAPIARLVLVYGGVAMTPGAPPPLGPIVYAALYADLLVLVAIAFDWRMRGGPHPAYLVGGVVLVLFQLTRQPVAESAVWRAVAHWIFGLAG